MKSYSFPLTIFVLSSLALSASAAASEASQPRKLLDGFDVLESSSEQGLLGNWVASMNEGAGNNLKPSDGSLRLGNDLEVEESKEEDLSSAIEDVSALQKKMRGTNLRGANDTWRRNRGKGKGSKKGCKKQKSEKSKSGGKGKGGGKDGKNFGFNRRLPTNRPTSRPTNRPTPSPVGNADEICPEGYEPSGAESTKTKRPTPSSSPTEMEPTDSPAPTESPAPTTFSDRTQAPFVPAGNEPLCEVFPASRTSESIAFWSESNAQGRTSNGSAALAQVVASPVQRSDTDESKISVSISVDMTAGANDADADMNGDSTFDTVDVGLHFDAIVTEPIALYVVGCPEKSLKTAEAYYWSHKNGDARVLESNESQFVSLMNWNCDYAVNENSSCDNGNVCEVKCTTVLNYVGDLERFDVDERIAWSIKEYFSLMDDVTAWYPMQQIGTLTVEEKDTDDSGVNAIEDSNLSQAKQMKAGPFIGAATGLLALILLLVLFVRRRNRNDIEQISHLKLDESADDNTFYNGSDGNSEGGIAKHEYNTRDIHIVGEGDSVISHWTGYTGNVRSPTQPNNYDAEYNKSSLVKGISTDVHQCSSATCEICALQRQAGLNFVPTGVTDMNECLPARVPSLPSDASREYAAEDTVEL